jgi:hypothetical protein
MKVSKLPIISQISPDDDEVDEELHVPVDLRGFTSRVEVERELSKLDDLHSYGFIQQDDFEVRQRELLAIWEAVEVSQNGYLTPKKVFTPSYYGNIL